MASGLIEQQKYHARVVLPAALEHSRAEHQRRYAEDAGYRRRYDELCDQYGQAFQADPCRVVRPTRIPTELTPFAEMLEAGK